jgi:nitrite reductase/ring-hydroxylating ferredoxin subunit
MPDKLEHERTDAAASVATRRIEECTVDGRQFARIELDGKTLLVPPKCPHRGAPISEARVVGKFLVCGRHGATFDLRTGKWLRGPSCKDITIKVMQADSPAIDTARGV